MALLFVFIFTVYLAFKQPYSGLDSMRTMVPRHNYGVIFKYQSKAYLTSGYWPDTFHCVLPSLTSWPTFEDWCSQAMYKGVCSEFPFLIALANNFTNHTYLQFYDSLNAVYDLLPESPLPTDMSKRKRSLFPFFGKLASSLFGTVSEDDIETIVSHVNALIKSQSQLLSGFQKQSDHMSSFMT